MLSARGGYVALILVATIAQVIVYPALAGARARLRYALDPALTWHDAYDALRNVFLFAGLGAIWLVTSPPTRLRDAIWRATATGALLSVSVELLQVFTPLRVASIADVATNALGSFAGAAGAGLIVAAVRAQRGHRSVLGIPMFVFAIGNFGALLAEALAPRFPSALRVSLAGGLRARLWTAMHSAEPAAVSHVPALDIILALPAGAFGMAALFELGLKRWQSVVVVALGGAMLVLPLELAHGVSGRPIVWSSAVARVLGILMGAAAAAFALPRLRPLDGVARARLIATISVAAIMLWSWRPYQLRGFRRIAGALLTPQLIPLGAYPYTDGLLGVGEVIHLASLGMMVGALLAVWPLRARGALAYVWPAAWLALATELGHAFIVGRLVDITGFLVLFAGAWLGDAVMRRAGFRKYGHLLPDGA